MPTIPDTPQQETCERALRKKLGHATVALIAVGTVAAAYGSDALLTHPALQRMHLRVLQPPVAVGREAGVDEGAAIIDLAARRTGA